MKYDSAKDARAGDMVRLPYGADAYVITSTADGMVIVMLTPSGTVTAVEVTELRITQRNG